MADQVLGKERKERGNYEKNPASPTGKDESRTNGRIWGVLLHLLVKLIR